MHELITAATQERAAADDSAFAALHRTASWMLIAGPVVFAIGFVLLLVLWRTLEQYNRATRKTYLEIEQLSRLRGEFVSIVSHEFRTPLSGIQGFSEMMRDEQLTQDEMREYAGDINKHAQRLARLINDMLDLDKLESGGLTLNSGPVDLNWIRIDSAALLRSSVADRSIELPFSTSTPSVSTLTNGTVRSARLSPSRASIDYGGAKVTEASLNGFPSNLIADKIQEDPYRFLGVRHSRFGTCQRRRARPRVFNLRGRREYLLLGAQFAVAGVGARSA